MIEIKSELLKITKTAYNEKLFAGTSGNLSLYDRETEKIYITASGIPYETMTEDDVVVINIEGKIIEGKHKPSSEWQMHTEIYKNLSNVNAIVHTHSPYATSFAVNHKDIPVVLIEMVPFIGGDIKVSRFELPGTEELGKSVIEKLKDRNACLMANHGVVAIGKNLEEAHIRAVYVEDVAKIYSIALNNGEAYRLPEKYIKAMKGER